MSSIGKSNTTTVANTKTIEKRSAGGSRRANFMTLSSPVRRGRDVFSLDTSFAAALSFDSDDESGRT
jgi:hypothetical protein